MQSNGNNKKTGFNFKTRTLVLAAAAVVGGSGIVSGLGAVNANAMDGSSYANDGQAPASTTNPGHSIAAESLRVTMNNLLREHVTTSLDATRTIVRHGSESEINAAVAAQYLNSDALSAAVGSVYGGAAQDKFSQLFAGHIGKSNAYAMAVARGDDSGKQAALTELQTYLHDLAAFFASAIPGLQEQDAYGMLNEHEELVNKSTEAYAAGDYVQSYQIEREGLKQISMAADALSGGIIATQPALFQ